MKAPKTLLTPSLQNVWTHEDFIINLIKCDLIHTKFLYGFRDMSLDSNDYSLPLYEAILWTLGIWEIEPREGFADWYFERTSEVKNISVPDHKDKMGKLANKIFKELLEKRKKIAGKTRQKKNT